MIVTLVQRDNINAKYKYWGFKRKCQTKLIGIVGLENTSRLCVSYQTG